MNNKDEQTVQQTKQEEQSVSILKKLSQMDEKTKKIVGRASLLAASLALSVIMIVVSNYMSDMPVEPVNSYAIVQSGDKNVSGTDGHVKFDAFFLQNNNGVAQGVRGINTEIGKQSTLYMELNVLTEGYLKDAKITINGKNFYLATSIEQDSEIKNDYIGSNVREIELNQINNGTQKEITGLVRSGDYSSPETIKSALGENQNYYSRSDNTIILTGTYVNGENEEIIIRKEVPLTVEWYEEEKEENKTLNITKSLTKGTPSQTLGLRATASTEKIYYQVNKIWDDNNNENGKRPAQLKFEIYKAGTNTKVAEYTITTASESSHTFELDKYDANENLISYEAREVEVNTDDLKFYTATEVTPQNITIIFDANGGTGTMENQTITHNIPTQLTENAYTKTNLAFDLWTTNPDGTGTRYLDEEEITITEGTTLTLYAQWTDKVAEVNGVYYNSLQAAINAVPTDNTETTVRLIQNTSEILTVAEGQNIIFNLQKKTISNRGLGAVITNDGTITIKNGIITTTATNKAAIDNNPTGKVTMSGGKIIVAEGGRQALYNDQGIVEISGTAYLSSESIPGNNFRATVQNQAGGTLTIKGGTIISKNYHAVQNAGTMTIGIEGGGVDTTSPLMQGGQYGIYSTSNFSFYDGIAKGVTNGISNETKVTQTEAAYWLETSEEEIGGVTYQTAYLGTVDTSKIVTIEFDANGGTGTMNDQEIHCGIPTSLTPNAYTKTDYVFYGWNTSANGTGTFYLDKQELTFARENTITLYAQWTQKVAAIDGVCYDTLQLAVSAVPTNNTETTVRLLKNTNENITTKNGQNIILDLQNNTLKDPGTKAVITNKGILEVKNGTVHSSATTDGAINNEASGRLKINGATVMMTASGGKQALYNNGGILEITGDAYISSASTLRGTVHNKLTTGSLTIKGGTIVATGTQSAVVNEGTMTIGTEGGGVDTTTPIMQGATFGIESSTNFSFYDGIAKGKTRGISDATKATPMETGYEIETSQENIGGIPYYTAYLVTNGVEPLPEPPDIDDGSPTSGGNESSGSGNSVDILTTFTNTFTVPDDKISIVANKVWDDNNNANNTRPSSIKFVVSEQNGVTTTAVANYTLTTASESTHTFTNLPKYDVHGDEIIYILTEEEVNTDDLVNYTTQVGTGVTVGSTTTYTVTNTLIGLNESKEVTVTKVWSDNNNSLGIRPSSVQATLSAYITNQDTTTTPVVLDQSIPTTVTLRSTVGQNNGDNWTYTWEDLPKYDSNLREIEYEVEEVPLTGNLALVYSSVVTESALNENEFTITNTYTAPTEKINYQVNKVWSDNNNANSKRPASLKFEIYNTGTSTKVAEYTITTASETSHTFELNKYDATGNVITYEAREVEVNTDDLKFYTTSGGTLTNGTVEGNPGYISTFTNTFTVPDDKVSIVANKVWSDNNDEHNKRPASIKFVVSKPDGLGTTAVANYTLTTASESSHTFTNLPKYDSNGNEISYILTEEEVNTDDLKFYTTQVSNGTTVGSTTTYTVTNTFTVPNDKISIEATKVWVDNNDAAQKRPSSVTIILMNDNTQVATDIASSSNGWTVIFSNLAKYDSTTGEEIDYTLDEAEVTTDDLEFYTLTSATVTPPANGSTYTGTITNTFISSSEVINIPVTKVWEDNSNANGTRLSSIDLTLTGNGQTYTHRLTSSNVDPTNSNNWIYTFTHIPKYDSNNNEITYVLSETGVHSGDLNKYISTVSGYTVTNKEIIEDIEVEKIGTSIIYAKDATVSYTINYTAEVDRDYTGNSTITIVDTLPYEIDTSKTYNLNGGTYNSSAKTITWTGTYNPSTNIITWSNNTTTELSSQLGSTNRITVQKNVSMVFDDIDLTLNSFTNEVEGTITLANGTELEAEDDFTTTTYFKRNIIINKVWRGDTGANTRPETIRVQVSNGATTVEQHTMSSSMNWTDTFTNLPRYDTTTGNEITYTITEDPVPSGYYVEIAEDTSSSAEASKTTPNDIVYTVTNSKYGSVHITKVDRANNTIKLGGAEFRLTKLKYENNEWVVDNTFSPVTQITSSTQATLGETTFSNLQYGKYRLEETVAPDGYNLLRSTVDIDITDSSPDFEGNVENIHKTLLPATGGEYKVIILIVGLAMIITAVHINNQKKIKAKLPVHGKHMMR